MLKVLLQLIRSRSEDLNSGWLAPKPFLNSGESGRELASHVSLPGVWNLPRFKCISRSFIPQTSTQYPAEALSQPDPGIG